MSASWLDSPQRYGLVSRLLHWSMAALFLWQYLGMGIKIVVGRHPVTGFMVGSHKPIGTVLMLLILLRGAWGLSQWRRRPPHPPGAVGKLAALGHATLYGLMAWVPAVALLREFGGGKGFAPFGIQLFPQTGQEIAWMLWPASVSHSLLAWVLLALVAGHVAMVVLHQVWWRDATLSRMAGKL